MHKDTLFYKKQTIRCGQKLLSLDRAKLMGILNITPDSFYDGGNYTEPQAIKKRIDQMVEEGADIIDIGGYSSRPGAEDINPDKEYSRLAKALEIIRKHYANLLVSIDTFRASVAEKAILEFQIDIVNDISGGQIDQELEEVVAQHKLPYIIMHMKGTPQNMMNQASYKHIVEELIVFFANRTYSLTRKGIHDIIIDPGFGFSKNLEHNYQLLAGLDQFKILEYPIMVGLSRKSMIYKELGVDPNDALTGTTALHMEALRKGARILRVHDVKEAKQTIQLFEKLETANSVIQHKT